MFKNFLRISKGGHCVVLRLNIKLDTCITGETNRYFCFFFFYIWLPSKKIFSRAEINLRFVFLILIKYDSTNCVAKVVLRSVFCAKAIIWVLGADMWLRCFEIKSFWGQKVLFTFVTFCFSGYEFWLSFVFEFTFYILMSFDFVILPF